MIKSSTRYFTTKNTYFCKIEYIIRIIYYGQVVLFEHVSYVKFPYKVSIANQPHLIAEKR